MRFIMIGAMLRLWTPVVLAFVLAAPAVADMTAADAALGRHDQDGALAALKPAAESGDARAQIALGEMYLAGRGVERDSDVAEPGPDALDRQQADLP